MSPTVNYKYPLNETQKSLWTTEKLYNGDPINNTPYVIDIYGELDHNIFREAFDILVQKSDALQIAIGESNGIPYQYTRSINNYYSFQDLSNFVDAEEKATNWIHMNKNNFIDISTKCLQSTLFKISDHHYKWFLNMHHVAVDATSISLIHKHLGEIYKILESGNTTGTYAIPQFFDFTESDSPVQKDNTPNDRINNSFFGNKHNAIKDTRNERVKINLSDGFYECFQKIQKLDVYQSFSPKLTEYCSLTSMIMVWLSNIIESNEVNIDTPLSNRATAEHKKAIGCFMKMRPFSFSIDQKDTFLDVYKNIQSSLFNSMRKNEGTSKTSSNIVFNYIDSEFGDFANRKTKVVWLHPGYVDDVHDLRIQYMSLNGENTFDLYLDININLYEKGVFNHAAEQLEKIAHAFLEMPNSKVLEQEYISSEELNILVNNNRIVNNRSSFVKSFIKTCELYGDNVAIVDNNNEIKYSELYNSVLSYITYLKNSGIKQNEKVGVHLLRSSDYLISTISLMCYGATFIPLPYYMPRKRRDTIIRNADLTHIISSREEIIDKKILSIPSKTENVVDSHPLPEINNHNTSYILYTSGSSGTPKGVEVSQLALSQYIETAAGYYGIDDKTVSAFYTSIGFDLTITSIFPILSKGGKVVIFKEDSQRDLSIVKVSQDPTINFLKTTPSHLQILLNNHIASENLSKIVIGGEQLYYELSNQLFSAIPNLKSLYNEYGPTEATVGCIVHQVTKADTTKTGPVPIGQPMDGVEILLLNEHYNKVLVGQKGEIFIGGANLAKGYHNDPIKTANKFKTIEKYGKVYYQSGDLARYNSQGELVYIGREDNQIKVNGKRVELGEIQSAINQLISGSSYVTMASFNPNDSGNSTHCKRCGIPDTYPNIEFDSNDVCELCNQFTKYEKQASAYFEDLSELKNKIQQGLTDDERSYDCLALLSGGKDSTYMVSKLADLGFKVLAFTLDNGYISKDAIRNIKKVVKQLGVDHVFGRTPAMNEIFLDSLHRHSNVCNGCFKVIYTLSIEIALKKKIPFIVSGLSRGQFFETRLTEELFLKNKTPDEIDNLVLDARKSYHKIDDAVKQKMDVSFLEDEQTFEKVKFLDFYRYTDVSLEQIYAYLSTKVPWVRPSDTGRSTNCLINQVGIYIHKKKRGYSNYAYPYSWDVRLGHKTVEESLDEINEFIDESEVQRILKEIKYQDLANDQIVAYYTGDLDMADDLKTNLKGSISEDFIPTKFIQLEKFPLTSNGKVDESLLPSIHEIRDRETFYESPQDDLEELLYEVFKNILNVEKFSVFDTFINLGGTSLHAIRIATKIESDLQLKVELHNIFKYSSVRLLSKHIEELMNEILNNDGS